MTAAGLGLAPDLGWEQIPAGIAHRDVAGVAVGPDDLVYLFTRFDHQVLVYHPDGSFVRAWGNGTFSNAHAVKVAPDGAVWCVDNGDHSVRKFSPDGELLLTLGTPGHPSDTGYRTDQPPDIHFVETVARAAPPFNGCTDVAVAADSHVFVSDGYGNCRIHHFDPDGNLLASWGEVGSGPGQFRLPHGICLTADGRLLVADRENDRIQLFDRAGTYLGEWGDVQRPTAMALTPDGAVLVTELWRPVGNRSFVADNRAVDLPSRMSLLSPDGAVLARWGASTDRKTAPGNFIAPHSVAVDSRGSVYVGEVTYTYAVRPGRVPDDHAAHQITKFAARNSSSQPATSAKAG